jgi:hypothetical protein
MKKGTLSVVKDSGYPNEGWKGASVIFIGYVNGNTGFKYADVEDILTGERNLFHAEQVIPEYRPWLKKHIQAWLLARNELRIIAEKVINSL